jgi:hypothetical protein
MMNLYGVPDTEESRRGPDGRRPVDRRVARAAGAPDPSISRALEAEGWGQPWRVCHANDGSRLSMARREQMLLKMLRPLRLVRATPGPPSLSCPLDPTPVPSRRRGASPNVVAFGRSHSRDDVPKRAPGPHPRTLDQGRDVGAGPGQRPEISTRTTRSAGSIGLRTRSCGTAPRLVDFDGGGACCDVQSAIDPVIH